MEGNNIMAKVTPKTENQVRDEAKTICLLAYYIVFTADSRKILL